MLSQIHSKKGFTLIELLLVIFLIAVLTTVAISSYMNSTDTFKFLSGYKQVMSAVRTARSYSITNKQKQDNTTPKYYGVCIASNRAIVFADSGDKELKMDVNPNDLANIGSCNPAACPDGLCGAALLPAAGAKYDSILSEKNFNFSGGNYKMEATNSTSSVIPIPLFLFYETGKGNLIIYDFSGAIINKTDNKFISIKFHETNGDAKKFIKISQVSGLAEGLNEL